MRRIIVVFSAILLLLGSLLAAAWFYQPSVPSNEPVVALLFGYNYFLKDSTTAKVYIERVLPYLRQCRKLQTVIVSGGVTRPTERPGESEAGVMRKELLARGVSVPIVMEERAQDTQQNVRFTAELLARDPQFKGAHVVIFSDLIQRPKVMMFALTYLRLWEASFVGIDLSSEHKKIRRGNAKSGR